MDLKVSVECEVDGETRSYDLQFKQSVITIGRHSGNDIQIPDMQVSSQHARILEEDGQPILFDLASRGGTLLDGVAVQPNRGTPLKAGARIGLASYTLVLAEPEQVLDEQTSEKTSIVAMKMVRDVLASLGGGGKPPYLEVMNDAETGTRLDLAGDDKEFRIGRDRKSELILRHWSISRKHALIRRSLEGVTVEDLGSKNGVMVNGDPVSDPRQLNDSDIILVGHTEIKYRNPAASLTDSLDDSPTPIHSLQDLGLDLSRQDSVDLGSVASEDDTSPLEESRAERAKRKTAADHKAKANARRERERTRTQKLQPEARRGGRPLREKESSLADYLPLIIGGILAICAVAAILFLFVLK